MAYTPDPASVRLCLLAAGALAVAGVLSFPFTLGLAGLTAAYGGSYDGPQIMAVLASAAALPLASLACIGASVSVLARLMASKPRRSTVVLLGIAAGALPLAFAFWQIVAWWVAQ